MSGTQPARNAILTLAATIGVAVGGWVVVQSLRDPLEDFAATLSRICLTARRATAQDGQLSSDLVFIDAVVEGCRKEARAGRGDRAKAFNAVAEQYTQTGNALRAYVAALDAFQAAGGADFEILLGKAGAAADLAPVLDRVRTLARCNQALAKAEKDGPDGLRRRLTDAGLSAERVESVVDAFRTITRNPLCDGIRECDATYLTALGECLELLSARWGRWRRDAASGQIEFDDAADNKKWATFIGEMVSASERQAGLQQQFYGTIN